MTKTGDSGDTGLGDGSRVPKDDPRIEAIGDVDELNATLGLLLVALADHAASPVIKSAQNDLFDLGADLCVPPAADDKNGEKLRVTADHVKRLEAAIEKWNAGLPPLTSFVLPGGTPPAAWCHLARTVCRRAERAVVTLMRSQKVGSPVLIYLNRLSDLLFVLARVLNGGADVLWSPGGVTHD